MMTKLPQADVNFSSMTRLPQADINLSSMTRLPQVDDNLSSMTRLPLADVNFSSMTRLPNLFQCHSAKSCLHITIQILRNAVLHFPLSILILPRSPKLSLICNPCQGCQRGYMILSMLRLPCQGHHNATYIVIYWSAITI